MECRNCPDRKNCRRQCMKLPNGKTCADCMHTNWCVKVYGVKPENTSCHFEPVRFVSVPKLFGSADYEDKQHSGLVEEE